MILLSCKQTGGVNAVAIYKDGYLVKKVSTKLPSGLGLYDSYIEGFKRAFSTLRCHLESEGYSDSVVVECNSIVFTSWLRRCEPNKSFTEAFSDMWREYDKIPAMCTFVNKHVVKAEAYANKSELKAVKLDNTF